MTETLKKSAHLGEKPLANLTQKSLGSIRVQLCSRKSASHRHLRTSALPKPMLVLALAVRPEDALEDPDNCCEGLCGSLWCKLGSHSATSRWPCKSDIRNLCLCSGWSRLIHLSG